MNTLGAFLRLGDKDPNLQVKYTKEGDSDLGIIDIRLGCSMCNGGIASSVDYNIKQVFPDQAGTANIGQVEIIDEDEDVEWPIYRICTNHRHIKKLYRLRQKLVGYLSGPITLNTNHDLGPNVFEHDWGITSDLDSDFDDNPPDLDSIKEVHICNVCYYWIQTQKLWLSRNRWFKRLPKIHGQRLFWASTVEELIEFKGIMYVNIDIEPDVSEYLLDAVTRSLETSARPMGRT